MINIGKRLALLAGLILGACGAPTATPTPAGPGVLAPRVAPDTPALATRAAQIRGALNQEIPILLLAGLNDEQRAAQDLAIRDPRFQANLRDTQTGAPLRNEIFGVYPTRESDYVDEATAACRQSRCYRVEMYSYAYNLTTFAIVDIFNAKVLTVATIQDTQPDLPPDLAVLAAQIAVNAPEVIEALGYPPGEEAATMANAKTALNRTLCERSRHLCVAPTFLVGQRALWAIVDLTDGALVCVRWTDLGASNAPPITEQSLQNEVVSGRNCENTTSLERNGWRMDYILTSSDGLRISDVRYQGQPVLHSAKLVDMHVSYSGLDGFGYSDAVGCPVFSQAAVVAFQGPTVEDIRQGDRVVGFALEQHFWSDVWPLPCNYYYEQRYEFYTDGRFRVVAGNSGRGCGDHGTYRPVTRIAMAGDYTFAEWDGAKWVDWTVERWGLQTETPYTLEGYAYRFVDRNGHGYYVEPGRGQFGDGGRGDNAYVYVTRRHPDRDEGESDMITIGPCCNTDYRQGPEKYIEPSPDPIVDSPIVIWYVAQLKNDDTPGQEYCWADFALESGTYVPKKWPCYAGPMFVPFQDQP